MSPTAELRRREADLAAARALGDRERAMAKFATALATDAFSTASKRSCR